MPTRNWIVAFLLTLASSLAAGCGGGDTEAEATWETHTTAESDDTSGGEGDPE